MYQASSQYFEKSKDYVRKSRTKIVVGTKELDGAHYLKKYPIFSHSTSKMIGGFPLKEVSFTVINKNNEELDFINNEIKIYKGLVLNDSSVEWIPQGVFIASPENVETSPTTLEITVKATDKAVNTEILRIDNIVYPCSELNYIKDVVQQCGLELESESFPFPEHILNERPNYDETSTSCREIISRFAEERGCIAIMSRTGKVWIKPQTTSNLKIYNYQYKNIPSCEKEYGPIDAVALGHENMNDDIVYPSPEELPNPQCLWTINDNPFLDSVREERIEEVFDTISGMKLIPFQIESCLDNYCIDLNDIIEIQKKDGSWVSTTVLSYKTSNRLMCDISAEVQDKKMVNYNLAGSLKKELSKVQIDVDHINDQIIIIAEQVKQSGIPRYDTPPVDAKENDIYLNTSDDTIYVYQNGEWKPTSISPDMLDDYYTKEETSSRIELTTESINSSVINNTETINNIQSEVNQLKQTSSQLELSISKVGGINLIENSSWQNGFDKWLETIEKPLIIGESFPSNGESVFWHNTKDQDINLQNQTIHVTVGMYAIDFNPTTTEYIPLAVSLTDEEVLNLFHQNYISSVNETLNTSSYYLLNYVDSMISFPQYFNNRNIKGSIIHKPFNINSQAGDSLFFSVKMNGYINYGNIKILIHYLDGDYDIYSQPDSMDTIEQHILKSEELAITDLTDEFIKFEIPLDDNLEYSQLTVEFIMNDQRVIQSIYYSTPETYRTLVEKEYVYFEDDTNIYRSQFKDVNVTYVESEEEPTDKREDLFWYDLINQKMKRYIYQEKHEVGIFQGYELVLVNTDVTREDVQKGYQIRIYDRLVITGKLTSELMDVLGTGKMLKHELVCNISECMLSSQQSEWQPASGENFWGRDFKFSQDGISIISEENGYKRTIDADEDIAVNNKNEIIWSLTPDGILIKDLEVNKISQGHIVIVARDDGNYYYYV